MNPAFQIVRCEWSWQAPDPAARRPETFRRWLAHARDIILYDFYMAANRPDKAPGAVEVRTIFEVRMV